MGNGPGHIELARALDAIGVGRRHRADLGDIDALAASIDREGLLQPITITPDGVLVCGLRRLAAMRKLGWKTANVWVRSGISDRLGQLLAEQDDNTLHKPLTQTEAATLYRELKGLLAEDAARRQEASRFTAGGPNPRSHGGATVAPPSDASPSGTGVSEVSGKTREQAALMVTGRSSYTSLERISELQRLAGDPDQPAAVRDRAAAELEQIDAGGSITAAHQRTRAELSLAELDRIAADAGKSQAVREQAARGAAELREAEATMRATELERLAADALARVKTKPKGKRRPKPTTGTSGGWERRTLRAFVLTWDDLDSWWEHYDPAEVGTTLTEEQWERFAATVAGTVAFCEAAEVARRQGQLRTA